MAWLIRSTTPMDAAVQEKIPAKVTTIMMTDVATTASAKCRKRCLNCSVR